jgi:glycosyltransferase involved in cell wall biosynthesis
VPANRIRVIRNGIDVRAVEPVTQRSQGWRAVHVARLNFVKDQETLLRAARIVADQAPHFRLDIVGDGELREPLERLAADLALDEIVTFHGMQQDIRPFLASADAFVLSSVSEGIALTLLEAMAAGLPIVATDVGGNREVVIPGETGFLVPAGDPAALAGGMTALFSNPDRMRRFGSAARRRAVAEFSVGATVAAYETLYLSLLKHVDRTVAQ